MKADFKSVKANATISAIQNFLVNFVLSENREESHLLCRKDIWDRATAYNCRLIHLITWLQRQQCCWVVLLAVEPSLRCVE